MKGDFTRSTFRPQNGYTSVRMQQGRLQVDADWNEQADIMAYLYQSQALDMLGVAAAPRTAEQSPQADVFENFRLKPVAAGDELNVAPGSGQLIAPGEDLKIAPGHIYIDGVLCELSETVTYLNQPYYADGKVVDLRDGKDLYLAYLDVWQRHITALDAPQIREIALASVPDTTTRLKTIWQVKLLALEEKSEGISLSLNAAKEKLKQPQKGQLQLRIDPSRQQNNLANEQSVGNALYRVEIHDSGAQGTATFKWSNNNGIVVSQILQVLGGNTLVIDQQARDDAYKFSANDWIEIIDTAHELRGEPGLLVKLTDKTTDGKLVFDPATTISVESNHPVTLEDFKGASNQNIFKVRRWEDIISGPTRNIIQTTGSRWIDLDDSALQVRFPEPENPNTAYATGDYWLIPMRFGIPYLEGLNINTDPKTVLTISPEGIDHSYAPLALVRYDKGKFSLEKTQEELDRDDTNTGARGDFRVTFPSLTRCLDSFGGVIQGSLEVQKNLLVTQSRDDNNNLIYGRLGIGTYEPQARMHVEVDDPELTGQIIQAAQGQQNNLQEWYRFDGDTPVVSAVVSAAGNLGLGIPAPTVPLAVRGNIQLYDTNQSFHGELSTELLETEQTEGNSIRQLTFKLDNSVANPAQFAFTDAPVKVEQNLLAEQDLVVTKTARANQSVVGSLDGTFEPQAMVHVEARDRIGQIIIAAPNQTKNLQEWHGLQGNNTVISADGNLGLGTTPALNVPLAVKGKVQLLDTSEAFHSELSAKVINAATPGASNTRQLTFHLDNSVANPAQFAFTGAPVHVEQALLAEQDLIVTKTARANQAVVGRLDETFEPQAVVHVEARDRIGQIIAAAPNQTKNLQEWHSLEDGNATVRAVVSPTGNLGLGITVPTVPLAVKGKVQLFDTNQSFHTALTASVLPATAPTETATKQLNFHISDNEPAQFTFTGGLLKANAFQLSNNGVTITKFSNQLITDSSVEGDQTVPTAQAIKQYVTDITSNLSDDLKTDLSDSLTTSLTSSLSSSLATTLTTQIQTAVGSKADVNGSLRNDFKANHLEIGSSLDATSEVSAQQLTGRARLQVRGTNPSTDITGEILPAPSQIATSGEVLPTPSQIKTNEVLQKGDSILVEGEIKLVTGSSKNGDNQPEEQIVTVSPPFALATEETRESQPFSYQKQSPIAHFTDNNGEDQLTLTAQGNLIVGPLSETSQPPADAKLYVEGKVFGQQVESDEVVGQSIVQLSSQTLKENISALSEDEANVLLGQLDPVKYSYRQDETRQTHVGFIAEAVPDVVASANHQGISPLDITAILTKVVQDHHQELNMMKTIIEQQQQTIQTLTAKVEQLERRRFRL